ncbi:MAG: hypothetical protein WCK86_02465 [Planctomycetia bacterium]
MGLGFAKNDEPATGPNETKSPKQSPQLGGKSRQALGRLAQRIWAGGEVFIEGIVGLAGIQRGGALHVSWNVWCVAPEFGACPRKAAENYEHEAAAGGLSQRLVLAGASWLYARIQLVALRAGKKFAIAICALRPKKRDFLSSRSGLNRRGRVAGCCIADAKSHRDAPRRLFFAAQPGNTVGAG